MNFLRIRLILWKNYKFFFVFVFVCLFVCFFYGNLFSEKQVKLDAVEADKFFNHEKIPQLNDEQQKICEGVLAVDEPIFSIVASNRLYHYSNSGDSSIFRRLISPNGFYSERFIFRNFFIPIGRFFELYLVLWSERLIIRRVIAPKILIPKCHCSERFLIRKVFIPNGFYPGGFWSERFYFRKVVSPKFEIKTFRIKNRSDQKNFMMPKHFPKL